MGGRKRIGTIGLLLASAAIFYVPSSSAADLTIAADRTTPVDTSTGDGTGPGNINVQSGVQISVAAPAAVTINSNNSVSSLGSINNSQESNATAVLVDTTKNGVANNITGSIYSLGSISVFGPQQGSSLLNSDVFNTAIRVSGLGTFTGDITNDGLAATDVTTGIASSLFATGNGSTGILVQSAMIGNITNKGQLQVEGLNTYGIAITGALTGNIVNEGVIATASTGATGLYVGGGMSGTIYLSGAIIAGTGSVVTSTNGVTLTTLDPTPAKAGLWIASSVNQGVFMLGNHLTLAQEGVDPTTAAAATPVDSSITVIGPVAVLVTQGGLNSTPTNIVVAPGPDTGGYSFRTSGNITINGTVKGTATTAIDVHGFATGSNIFTSTFSGGIWNDKGDIHVVAQDARAIALNIGAYGSVTRFQNDGDILSNTVDSTSNQLTNTPGTKGGDAYGIVVEAQGSLPSFANTRNIVSNAQGGSSSAYGIVDRSGTLTTFFNSGLINTVIQNGSSGRLVGVDMSANTTGATFDNTGTIIGDVLLGGGNNIMRFTGKDASVTGTVTFQAGAVKSGNNTFAVDAGTIFGVVNLGNGTHNVSLTNGAKMNFGFTQGTGTMVLAVDASQLTISGSHPLNASTATFSNASTLTFNIDNAASTVTTGVLQSTGTISISANSKITARFTGLIDGQKTITAVRANSLVLGAPLSTLATSPNSYINSTAFSMSPTDPNTILLTVRRRSATELGLGPNRTAIYNAFTTALNQDVPIVTAVSAAQTADEFDNSVGQLMPDSSGALQQAAMNNQDMASGAIRRRLVGVAKNGMPDHASGDIASFWAQALGDYSDQHARGEQAGFDIWGLGIAFGADLPAFDGSTIIGMSFTETWHSANLQISKKSPIQFYNTQLALYGRYSGDAFYFQANAGGGYNSYNQERHVDISDINRIALSKWKGYEYGGTAEAGYAIRLASFQWTPFVRGSYQRNHENGFSETGGGTGVNLTVAARNPENARATAGFTLDRDFPIYYDSYVEAEFRANYTREVMNNPYAVVAQFGVGPSFTTYSNARDPNRANVGFGVAHKDSYSSVSVDYDVEVAKGYLAHKAAITARFRF